ncbi:D-alanyl-D-alanine carboxypeptidase family protein [Gorillibacterium massiliense]|uniref:D-alanyl-D-alanine carboxypeptidase family protein n=1 Tax=Gorillibacterium massiliense TaxID=1280390 RepID=UPI0004B2025C|nr:D-alanyl-D-alanine carboxypeptidase family protein [Gorillibacterium massiliense]
MKVLSRMKKKLAIVTVLSLGAAYIPFSSTSTTAYAAADTKLDIQASSAILIEAATGQVLYEQNADEMRAPASMSKMMTEYIALDQIAQGKLKLDDIVTTSEYAASVEGSGQQLAEGDQLTVDDIFYAISVGSANDAAIALGERIAGSEKEFAKMMNDEAKKLGLSDKAYFVNASGLEHIDVPKKFQDEMLEGETTLSARDTAKLAAHLVNDHPEILKYSSTVTKDLPGKDPMENWNWMLEGKKNTKFQKDYAYVGMDGLKTGHTDNAGWCFTGTAERNGIRLISVVMNTKAEKNRFTETRKLMDYGFSNFEFKKVISKDEVADAVKTIKVKKGIALEVPVATDSEETMLVKKGAKDEEFVKSAKAEVEFLKAPVKKGTEVGTLTVKYNGMEKTVKLVATEDVKKAGWFKLFMRGTGDFFSSLGKKIKKLF